MKARFAIATAILLIGAPLHSAAQGGQKWSVNGNNVSGGDAIGTNNNFPLILKADGVERMWINTNGMIGVGTSSPTANFHVDGTFRFNDGTAQSGYVLTTDGLGNATWAPAPVPTSFWQATGSDIFFDSGNVAIGGTNAPYPLTVNGEIFTNGKVSANELSVIEFIQTKTGVLIENVLCIQGDDGTGLTRNELFTETSEFYLQSSPLFNQNTIINCGNTGFVGIGNCNPTVKLDVTGDMSVSGVINAGEYIKAGSSSTYIGAGTTPSGSNENYVFTTSGPLRINGDESSVNLNWAGFENTEINPDGGTVMISTYDGEPITGESINSSIYQCVVGGSLMVTGANSTISWRGPNLDGAGNPQSPVNLNGDISICIEDRPNGDPGFSSCGGAIRGLNFFRSFPHDAGFQNWDMFISTLPGTAGHVGIGTPYPVYRLTVNGVIGSREIVVETTDWCDYVFDKEYDLMPLNDLSDFIATNNHLPGFESEEVYEEDGLPLSEITRKQQEKIEELTLYIIEQEEKIQELYEMVNSLVEDEE